MEKLKYEAGKVPLIPTALTYCNLLLGATTIFMGQSQLKDLKLAAQLILLAAITDKLDGFAARSLNQTSEFGSQLDSLSDLISFGIAPGLLAWNLGLKSLDYGLMAVLIYIAAGAFRLARFNAGGRSDYIVGLPITLAGGLMALKHLLDLGYRLGFKLRLDLARENLILMLILAFLMIADFKIKKPSLGPKDLF